MNEYSFKLIITNCMIYRVFKSKIAILLCKWRDSCQIENGSLETSFEKYYPRLPGWKHFYQNWNENTLRFIQNNCTLFEEIANSHDSMAFLSKLKKMLDSVAFLGSFTQYSDQMTQILTEWHKLWQNNLCSLYRRAHFPLKTNIFNRPGVAGAVLQTSSSLIKSVTKAAFSSESSQHHKSQTVRARKLKFWENVHPDYVSHVRCQVSGVRR